MRAGLSKTTRLYSSWGRMLLSKNLERNHLTSLLRFKGNFQWRQAGEIQQIFHLYVFHIFFY